MAGRNVLIIGKNVSRPLADLPVLISSVQVRTEALDWDC